VGRDKQRSAGDGRMLDRLLRSFREKRYSEVASLARELQFPDMMTPSQRRMVAIARARLERNN